MGTFVKNKGPVLSKLQGYYIDDEGRRVNQKGELID